MGNDTHLRIRARIKPSSARELERMVRSTSFELGVPTSPGDSEAQHLKEDLEPFLWSVDLSALARDVLELDCELKSHGTELEVLLTEWLPAAIRTLEEAWFHDTVSGRHMTLAFEPKTRRFVERPGRRHPECTQCAMSLGEEPEPSLADAGALDRGRWRKAFAFVIETIASTSRQRALFEHAQPGREPVESWLDLHELYFDVLELKRGIAPATRAGYLTSVEAKALGPFHTAFKAYFPESYDDDARILADPRWRAICELARAFDDQRGAGG